MVPCPAEAVMIYLIRVTVRFFNAIAFLWVEWLGEGRCGTVRGHLEGSGEGEGHRDVSHLDPQSPEGLAACPVLPHPQQEPLVSVRDRQAEVGS